MAPLVGMCVTVCEPSLGTDAGNGTGWGVQCTAFVEFQVKSCSAAA